MDLYEKLIKPPIRELVRIKDTFDDRREYLRLDKKERLFEFDPVLFKKFKESIQFEDISAYYELGPTYRQLSAYLNVPVKQLFLTAGSDLAIKSVFEAALGKGDRIIMHSPSYAMLRVYAKMFGVRYTMVSVKEEDWSINYEKMLAKVDGKTKMVAIENPNGFVGTKLDEDQIEYMASQLHKKGILLLIDEAYYYIENSRSNTHFLIKKYPNVLITQTFSKAHGLAGVRFGCLIGSPRMIGYISRVKPMHEVNSMSARTAEWIMSHPKLLTDNQRAIAEGKKYLVNALMLANIPVKDTHANFVMIYLPEEGRTKNITKKLMKHKILIRRPFEESFLKGWALVCVGSPADARQFFKALTEILPTLNPVIHNTRRTIRQ